MCGFSGFWDFKKRFNHEELSSIVKSMSEEIKERGPDSDGNFCDETTGLALGFRRLAVIDLSPQGNQPMHSMSGRYIIIYNGEIYNAEELKQNLQRLGCQFRGTSDTEVILAACEVWGIQKACQKFIGMFAFALWDKQQQKLFLVRDRLGIKPLYWGIHQDILFFGSQPKSFLKHPKFIPEIDRSALTAYFRYNYIPAPFSIYKNIKKSSPGSIVVIDGRGQVKETRFWDFQTIVKETRIEREKESQQSKHKIKTITDELELLLKDAVKRRMVADVPLGAFLSGGIDSSTVVALMQAQSETPIKTFSIGFFENDFNEAEYAAKVAKHLGTEHHELYLESNDARDIIPDIPNWCDEPFADVSQIPTFLVSRLARQHVTVSLSGDGGDELFAGYNRYTGLKRLWQWMNMVPFWLRDLSAKGIKKVPSRYWDEMSKVFPAKIKVQGAGDKAYKLAEFLVLNTPQHLYQKCMSFWHSPEMLVSGGIEPKYFFGENMSLHYLDFIEKMQYIDTLTYLPDDILTKVDRASMAVSLEARVPLLDHRLVEFVWRLPPQLKIRQGKTKWLLREVLSRYVPNHLIERPKMGFGVPIVNWLRGPLKEWAAQYLSEEALESSGLNPEPIIKRWQEHLAGSRQWQYSLWGVLMFQAWKERWKM